MKTQRMLFFLSWLIGACASTPVSVAMTRPPPAVIAVQANAQSTETAIAIEGLYHAATQTSVAYTQEASQQQATLSILEATATQVALISLDAQATRAAFETKSVLSAFEAETAVAHVTEIHIIAQQTDIAAAQLSESLTATATASIDASTRAKEEADFFSFLKMAFMGALALVVVCVVAFVGGSVANRIDAEQRGRADAARITARGDATSAEILATGESWSAAMRARVFAHGGALVWVGDDGEPVILLDTRSADKEPSAPAQLTAHTAQPPIVNSANQSYPLVSADRQDIVKFLVLAVRRAGPHADKIDTIPSHKTMGIGAAGWTERVRVLEGMGFAEVVPNKGTFIRQYASLLALSEAVKNGAGHIPSLPQVVDSPE